MDVGNIGRPHVQANQHQNVGTLNGQNVRQPIGDRIRSSLSNAGAAIRNFFQGLSTKFDNWKEERSVASAKVKADTAGGKIVESLASGGAPSTTMSNLEALAKACQKSGLDPSEVLKSKFQGLPQEDKQKLVHMDFNKLAGDMKQVKTSDINKLADLQDNVKQAGFGGSDEGGEPIRNALPGLLQQIDVQVGHLKSAAKETKLSDLRSMAHGFLTISDNGKVAGRFADAKMPSSLTEEDLPPNPHHGVQEHTGVTLIETRGQQRLGEQKSLKTVGDTGTQIHGKAEGDWHRMNLVFKKSNGESYNTRLEPDQLNDIPSNARIPTKLKTSVEKLNEITGSPEATKVLSTVLHQFEMRSIVGIVAKDDGGSMQMTACKGGYNNVVVEDGDGGSESFHRPGQIGEAVISLSKLPNGDYQVDVDWEYITSGIRSFDSSGKSIEYQADPNNPTFGVSRDEDRDHSYKALKVNMQGQFFIDGNLASQGQLKIKNGGFIHDVSGKMTLPN